VTLTGGWCLNRVDGMGEIWTLLCYQNPTEINIESGAGLLPHFHGRPHTRYYV